MQAKQAQGMLKASKQEAFMDKTSRKQRLLHEVLEYWVTFIYLAAFFSSFTLYRKLVLAEHQVSSFHFGMALVEALIMAKVVLIGNALKLGRHFEARPLLVPTIYKAIVFSLLMAGFAILEHTLHGLIHGKGIADGVRELLSLGNNELAARCLVMFTAFLPFFAFQELGNVLGEGKIRELFLHRRGETAEISAYSK